MPWEDKKVNANRTYSSSLRGIIPGAWREQEIDLSIGHLHIRKAEILVYLHAQQRSMSYAYRYPDK